MLSQDSIFLGIISAFPLASDSLRIMWPARGLLWGCPARHYGWLAVEVGEGYLGRKLAFTSQCITEILQSFPDLILAKAISMAIGTGIQAVIATIAVTRIPFGGRVTRSVALTIKELTYIEAGRSVGVSQLRIMGLLILPQCLAPYLALATTHLGEASIIEAALDFAGVGISPPTPACGNILADALTSLVSH